MENRNLVKRTKEFVSILLGIGQKEKSLAYSGEYDFYELRNSWLSDVRLYSKNKKLIEHQMIVIFYQTSQINELYSMRKFLSKGKKLEKILSQIIRSQTLELIALTTSPVEVYRLMVIFISGKVGSCFDRNKIYLASKKRSEELVQITPMTTKDYFNILLLSEKLHISKKMKYRFN